LLRAAAVSPIAAGDLALAAGWPDDRDRAHRVAVGLVADGLLAVGPDGRYGLP